MDNAKRSIWHAFTALANCEDGQVTKSRLKVLTNSIGRALGIDKAEELLGDTQEDTLSFTLSFFEYFAVISPKLFHITNPSTGNDNNGNNYAGEPPSTPVLTPPLIAQIEQICWMLCEAYFHRNEKLKDGCTSTLNSSDLFKLWKVFNFLVNVDLDESPFQVPTANMPLRVDVEEAHRVGSLLRQAVGFNPVDVPQVDPTEEEEEKNKYCVDFVDFVVIVCQVAKDFTEDVMRSAITSIYEEILNDVIKKGYLEKLGNHVTKWKRRWFRLTAKQLQYFVTDSERERKGSIEVTPDVNPESLQVQRSHSKQFRIKLHTAGKSFELAAIDLRCKNEWITAMQKASYYSQKLGSYQLSELREREQVRKARRDRIAEDLFGKSEMRKQLKKRDEQIEKELQERKKDHNLLEMRQIELDQERLARFDVEAQLAEEGAALDAERQRLKELEEIKAMLEKLLDEERRAKHDEEIVRTLQARLLLEETEKREQLEFLRLEQDRLLRQEREEKQGLEKDRQKQAELLERTQHQLNILALERERADAKIREAEENMEKAEHQRLKMEERLRLHQMSTSIGLRKPLPINNPDPFVTHRGKGAFSEADFSKRDLVSQTSQVTEDN